MKNKNKNEWMMYWLFIIQNILIGISILGNVSTNGVSKEWQLFRGKILSKCNQFFSAKKVARLLLLLLLLLLFYILFYFILNIIIN